MANPTYRFRPQSGTKRSVLRHPEMRSYNLHWQERRDGPPPGLVGEPWNQTTIGRIFGRIHYLTRHAPHAVSVRWRPADVRMRKRFPSRRVSTHYENTFSAGRFL